MLDVDKTETAKKLTDESELNKTDHVDGAMEPDNADEEPDDCQPVTEKRKLPAWAIWVAVIAFVVFNAFFLVFAMQMGSGSPSD